MNGPNSAVAGFEREIPMNEVKLREAKDDSPKDPKIAGLPKHPGRQQAMTAVYGVIVPTLSRLGIRVRVLRRARQTGAVYGEIFISQRTTAQFGVREQLFSTWCAGA
jgi:hypothetical protein